MPLLLDFQSCSEVDSALLDEVFSPDSRQRDHVIRLLERMARVAQARRGAHRIFAVLGRLSRCDWIEGPIDVVVQERSGETEIDVRVDLGTRLSTLRKLSLRVPFSELSMWVTEHPLEITPLGVFGPPKSDQFRLRSDMQSLRPPPPAPASASGAHDKTGRGTKPYP